jgi:DNA invertase Pin-like site-specific DNA recombinase
MRVALYSRVSTKDGRQDAENQLGQLREFATQQGWELTHEFVDHESGSRSDRRPQFQLMFTLASQRKFDILLFWSLDRLSREGVLQTLTHLNRLASYGIAFRSFTEQYLDSCGIFRDAIISIMATLAKQERLRISERTVAGLKVARLKGKRLGRPRIAADIAAITQLRDSGATLQQISDQTGISVSSVFNLLRRSAV